MRQSLSLFSIARKIKADTKDVSVEASFMSDFDYTCRRMNENAPHYYFKQITREDDPEYFNVTEKSYPIQCVFELPEPTASISFSKEPVIYHTNDQKYYICEYSTGKPSTRYKPSSMHCMRNMYFQAMYTDLDSSDQKTPELIGICESGEDRHKRIQTVIMNMRKYGIDCDYVDVKQFVAERNLPVKVVSDNGFETKIIDEERNISFMCDGIIKYKGEYYIVEIKTEASRKWAARENVAPYHHYQAWTYSLEFGLDNILFIYENRDVCSKKPYMYHVTQENRDFIENRVRTCSEYVSAGKVPPKENTPEEVKACVYCEYRTTCKACGDGEAKNEEN